MTGSNDQEQGMYVVLLGPPGSGKGTQAAKLEDHYGVTHVATGDLFRKHLGEGTDLGRTAREYMDKGELVPDSVTVGMVRERLGDPDIDEGVLFDGFPRTLPQADALKALLAEQGERLDRVILLEVPEAVIIDRLAGRGRADDNPETIRTRLTAYREQTEPLIAYYRERDLLSPIDGVGTIDAIQRRIVAVIDEHVCDG